MRAPACAAAQAAALLVVLVVLSVAPARAALAPWRDTPSLDTWRKRAIYQVSRLHGQGSGRVTPVAAPVQSVPRLQELLVYHPPPDAAARYSLQVVTDRFASPELPPLERRYNARCPDLGNYCGGTFRGLTDRLEYIRGLNLDAVWPSPVAVQAFGGYHGCVCGTQLSLLVMLASKL